MIAVVVPPTAYDVEVVSYFYVYPPYTIVLCGACGTLLRSIAGLPCTLDIDVVPKLAWRVFFLFLLLPLLPEEGYSWGIVVLGEWYSWWSKYAFGIFSIFGQGACESILDVEL